MGRNYKRYAEAQEQERMKQAEAQIKEAETRIRRTLEVLSERTSIECQVLVTPYRMEDKKWRYAVEIVDAELLPKAGVLYG